ncbi:helix-turn-helix domain-containing protein [Paenibacillus donghaensis]|uniref:HTH araC/xylS-type domain-containing protein n=1 Tax=Paenibacillus donghaensis TaxID=414771 RepID=A0A2Z2KMD3_9BACL|nr:hypothetical protein B9T62_02630 [Paenibacillus donghaensis]
MKSAKRLHFNNQSYFTKSFKKFTGQTPRKFRQLWEIRYN